MTIEAPRAMTAAQEAVYFAGLRPEMRGFIPETAQRVLEIGCGYGRFSASLRRAGRVLWGVEPNPQAAAGAAAVLDHVIAEPLELALSQLEDASFDCIIANDVLEHIQEPWDALTALRRVLAPGGRFVASIPNVRHITVVRALWVDGRWDYDDTGILDRTHLRFFTPSTMREMFARTGYEVELFQGIKEYKLPWKLGIVSRLICKNPEELKFLQYVVRAKLA